MGDPQTGEQKYQRRSHTIVKILNPMSGFPAWESDKGTGIPQGIWPWRPAGFDYNTSTGLGETETPVFDGTYKMLCSPRPTGGTKTTCQCWRASCRDVGQQGLTTGTGALEGPPLVQALLEGTMVEITVTEQNIEKRMKRNEDSLRDLWDNIKCTQKEKRERKDLRKYLKRQ